MQIDWNRITTKTLLAGIKLHIIGNCHAWEIKPNRIRIEGFFFLKKTCCFNCGCVVRTAIGGIIGRTDWLMEIFYSNSKSTTHLSLSVQQTYHVIKQWVEKSMRCI